MRDYTVLSVCTEASQMFMHMLTPLMSSDCILPVRGNACQCQQVVFTEHTALLCTVRVLYHICCAVMLWPFLVYSLSMAYACR